MSSNLPPGVTESMIPGNRPEDAAYEAFMEAVSTVVDAETWTAIEDNAQHLAAIDKARELGYEAGFGDAKAEAEIDEALNHDEHVETFLDAWRPVRVALSQVPVMLLASLPEPTSPDQVAIVIQGIADRVKEYMAKAIRTEEELRGMQRDVDAVRRLFGANR